MLKRRIENRNDRRKKGICMLKCVAKVRLHMSDSCALSDMMLNLRVRMHGMGCERSLGRDGSRECRRVLVWRRSTETTIPVDRQ